MVRFITVILLVFFGFSLLEAENSSLTNKVEYKVKSEVFPEESKVKEYLKKREKREEKENKENEESSVRRFEIMFFSSGTIVYLSSMLFLKLFAEITTGYSSELPDEYWYYIGVNSVGIGLYIAIKDYKENRIEKRVENLKEKNYKLSLLNIKF